jgi:hypothetical protein
MGELGEHARRVHGGHPGQRGAGACEEQSGGHGLVVQVERMLYLIVGYPRLVCEASIDLSFDVRTFLSLTATLFRPYRTVRLSRVCGRQRLMWGCRGCYTSARIRCRYMERGLAWPCLQVLCSNHPARNAFMYTRQRLSVYPSAAISVVIVVGQNVGWWSRDAAFAARGSEIRFCSEAHVCEYVSALSFDRLQPDPSRDISILQDCTVNCSLPLVVGSFRQML